MRIDDELKAEIEKLHAELPLVSRSALLREVVKLGIPEVRRHHVVAPVTTERGHK
jgi:hypothetical protein